METPTLDKLETFYLYCKTNVSELLNKNKSLQEELAAVNKKYKKLEIEFKDYKKVSLVQKLDKDLMLKNNEIRFLNQKIKNLELKKRETNNNSDEEEEIELNEIEIKNKEYYISNDIHKNIYEKLENDDVGELLGKYIKGKIIYNN